MTGLDCKTWVRRMHQYRCAIDPLFKVGTMTVKEIRIIIKASKKKKKRELKKIQNLSLCVMMEHSD